MSGDNIFRDGCVGGIDAHHGSDIPAFIESLQRIQESDVEWLLPSHGPAFPNDHALLQSTSTDWINISTWPTSEHVPWTGHCWTTGKTSWQRAPVPPDSMNACRPGRPGLRKDRALQPRSDLLESSLSGLESWKEVGELTCAHWYLAGRLIMIAPAMEGRRHSTFFTNTSTSGRFGENHDSKTDPDDGCCHRNMR